MPASLLPGIHCHCSDTVFHFCRKEQPVFSAQSGKGQCIPMLRNSWKYLDFSALTVQEHFADGLNCQHIGFQRKWAVVKIAKSQLFEISIEVKTVRAEESFRKIQKGFFCTGAVFLIFFSAPPRYIIPGKQTIAAVPLVASQESECITNARSAFDFGASTPAGEKRGSLISTGLSSPSHLME